MKISPHCVQIMTSHHFKTKFSAWQKKIQDQGHKFRLSTFQTSSDIPVQPLYSPREETDYEIPGEFPFTRGVQASMYLGKLWTMRLYAGFATAEESNLRYRELIAKGGTGLSVAFDLPTQMGLDSDHPLAFGEVGKAGVAIDTLDDMRCLFQNIDLGKISTSMTINATAMILLAMYILVAEEQGVTADKLSGTIQNDILKEYIARGTYIFPPEASLRLITDIFQYGAESVPKFNTISVSGYHIREAGSHAVQEVAFTLAHGLAYAEEARRVGLKPNDFLPRMSFFFNAHNCFFEEVAKFRASRRLWAKLVRERFNAHDEACRLRFHTQTGGSTLTAQQSDNNVVRVAYQALAAVLGGTQSLHTNGRDEALSLPTPESALLALRTQQILALETGVADTVDPLAGSYYVEALTDEIEARAKAYIEKIDSLGGAVQALKMGFQQREIQNSAYKIQKAIEAKTLPVVGVNCLQTEETHVKKLHKVSSEVQDRQIEKLTAYKKNRDTTLLQNSLDQLRQTAQGSDNLFPSVLSALRAKATLGEIVTTLKDVFGSYESHVDI